MDQENMTTDLGSLGTNGKRAVITDKSAKKSRSKSIGPGGLDALTDTSGNRRKVGACWIIHFVVLESANVLDSLLQSFHKLHRNRFSN